MSSREKDSKSLQDKLKHYFRKSSAGGASARGEVNLCGETERELSAPTPVPRRVRAARDLADRLSGARLAPAGVERVWMCVHDVAGGAAGLEARAAALGVVARALEAAGGGGGVVRAALFRLLRAPPSAPSASAAAYPPAARLLQALTNHGRDLTAFEEQMGELIVEWFPRVVSTGHVVEFMQLVTNVVKFNAAYLDEEIVQAIVYNASVVVVSDCCGEAAGGAEAAASGEAGAGGGGAEAESPGGGALALLEACVAYSLVPRGALPALCAALCRAVCHERHTRASWKVMRMVVGAAAGGAALAALVRLAEGGGDAELVRGAVFHVGMALWGGRAPAAVTARLPHLAVLPALLRALTPPHPVVHYEVLLGVQALVTRAHHELHEPAWDLLLDILANINAANKKSEPPNELISSQLHAVLTHLETLLDKQLYFGDVEQLARLIDDCLLERPEASAIRWVRWWMSGRGGGGGGGGAGGDELAALAERHARREPRRAVRLAALEQLHAALLEHRDAWADEGWWRAAVTAGGADGGAPERAAAARLCAALLAHAPPDPLPPPHAAAAALDLLHNLERIANRPCAEGGEGAEGCEEGSAEDVCAGVAGLALVVRARLCRAPPALPARALSALLDHLEAAYRRHTAPPAAPSHAAAPAARAALREQIFDLIFSLRVNAYGCIGLVYETAGGTGGGAGGGTGGPAPAPPAAPAPHHKPVFSPYLFIDPLPKSAHTQPPIAGCACVGAGRVWRALGLAAGREGAWRVWARCVASLPPALPAPPPELDRLATALCACVAARPPPHADTQPRALAALARLAPHNHKLDANTTHRILRTILKYGVVLRAGASAACLAALTLYTLEARDTMVRVLPEVLLDLSKISDTKTIAGPMLEFLSTLTRLPRVFSSFVEDQYMSVFAILLPYTNPSRYDHYAVSLAHHVLAAWFLKCRLAYRRNFVRFIIHGLHNYIIMPFEEQLFKSGSFQQPPNEDSSSRKRSSSLGSQNVPRGGAAGVGGGAGGADGSAAFHLELTEACVDLLARYTHSPCGVRGARGPGGGALLRGGRSATWLVGHRLVTVTVPPCHHHPHPHRSTSIPSPAPPSPAPAPPAPSLSADAHDDGGGGGGEAAPGGNTNQLQVNTQGTEIRRYSKVSLQHSRSTDTSASSLSISEQPSPLPTRQNSGESRSESGEPSLAHRLDKLARDIEAEEAWGGSGGAGGTGGAGGAGGTCWCARWCEVYVRAPAGDTAFMMRLENQMLCGSGGEAALDDACALFAPSVNTVPQSGGGVGSSAGSLEMRSRSGSSVARTSSAESEAPPASPRAPPAPPLVPPAPPGPAPAAGTEPINIPPAGAARAPSPDHDQRVSRAPVRRSNSSPEMSSSWKLQFRDERPPSPPPAAPPAPPAPATLSDMILLPSCEPTGLCIGGGSSGGGSKKGRGGKGETRVSCEAIPEEITAGSPKTRPFTLPPHSTQTAHPHTAVYHADGGEGGGAVSEAPLQKVASDGSVGGAAGVGGDELPPLARSKRSNTISVMSPTRRKRETSSPRGGRSGSSSSSSGGAGGAAGVGGGGGGGVTPAFVLLQLYARGAALVGGAPHESRPLRVVGAQHERSVKNLDLTPPIDTYKVGVLYAGPGQQDNEVAILRNEHGSQRYSEFLAGLGSVVELTGGAGAGGGGGTGGADELMFLSLERGGRDGDYTIVWSDDIMQVQFHVATAMPTLASDPSANEKRKHIGNDHVAILYNDSERPFHLTTLKGQLLQCCIEVEPVGAGVMRVSLRTRDERIRSKYLAHVEPHLVSDRSAPLLARQVALHAALASTVSQSLKLSGGQAHASNMLERLRVIKRLRARLEGERAARPHVAPYAPEHTHIHIDDFTDYT